MLDTIFSIFWGIILILSIASIPYIIIRYEINRHQDKKKEVQGIYIRRVNRFEAYVCIFNPLIPFLDILVIDMVEIWVSGLMYSLLFLHYVFMPFHAISSLLMSKSHLKVSSSVCGSLTRPATPSMQSTVLCITRHRILKIRIWWGSTPSQAPRLPCSARPSITIIV